MNAVTIFFRNFLNLFHKQKYEDHLKEALKGRLLPTFGDTQTKNAQVKV